MVDGFSFRKVQMDLDGYFIFQFYRSEKLRIHIDHGNKVLFGKPFHVFKGKELPGRGTLLQVIQVIDDAEHIRIANGDDSLLSEGFQIL
ncbi:MAG: hypothetical protein BA870_01120 [Desulfuromonadales bacterium C00003094]|jgi:hypothetical protein|nr:MAG: hypothetical protein BA870_01120 [Desulfuromonadales bacterium C00003094]